MQEAPVKQVFALSIKPVNDISVIIVCSSSTKAIDMLAMISTHSITLELSSSFVKEQMDSLNVLVTLFTL